MKKLQINVENAEYQIIESLKMNRVKRSQLKEMFIEGIECIKQAVKANIEITRIIVKNINGLSSWGKNIVFQYSHAKIIEMPNELFRKLSDKTNPSEMLITAKINTKSFKDISAGNPFFIIVDRPSDHGNLGSIIRSANAFNADGIFIIGHGVDIYEPKVIRASLGSIFFTKIVQAESMETLSEYLIAQKELNNIQIIGTDSTGVESLKDFKLKKPAALVIGNEAKGMSKKLIEVYDKIVKIPMSGNINSLNVSCAASILMWEIFKN